MAIWYNANINLWNEWKSNISIVVTFEDLRMQNRNDEGIENFNGESLCWHWAVILENILSLWLWIYLANAFSKWLMKIRYLKKSRLKVWILLLFILYTYWWWRINRDSSSILDRKAVMLYSMFISFLLLKKYFNGRSKTCFV